MTRGGGKKRQPSPKLQAWIEARKRHRLSDAQVQMARALGLNPAKLGKIDNHHQEQWKLPLPDYIEELYFKRFGRPAPAGALSLEGQIRREREKKEARRATRQLEREKTAELPRSVAEAVELPGTPMDEVESGGSLDPAPAATGTLREEA